MIFLVCIAGLLSAFLMGNLAARKDREKSLRRFAEFCDNFNNKMKLLSGCAAVQALADKYGQARLTKRIDGFKNEASLHSFSREETLQNVIRKAETETDPDEKALLLALFYSTTTRWATDLGLAEDIVIAHLNTFAHELGFSKESAPSLERN